MLLTLNQAAKKSGRSKGTLSKALSNGTLSYVSKNKHGYQIDPSELSRVFPEKPVKTGSDDHLKTPKKTSVNSSLESELLFLRETIEMMKIERERERQTLNNIIEDLQKDRDHWREQAQQSTRLLEDKRERKPLFRLFK